MAAAALSIDPRGIGVSERGALGALHAFAREGSRGDVRMRLFRAGAIFLETLLKRRNSSDTLMLD